MLDHFTFALYWAASRIIFVYSSARQKQGMGQPFPSAWLLPAYPGNRFVPLCTVLSHMSLRILQNSRSNIPTSFIGHRAWWEGFYFAGMSVSMNLELFFETKACDAKKVLPVLRADQERANLLIPSLFPPSDCVQSVAARWNAPRFRDIVRGPLRRRIRLKEADFPRLESDIQRRSPSH